MELYISDHPLDCLTCAANGDCELQDMAGAVGLREVRYGYDGANHVFETHEGRVQPGLDAEGREQSVLHLRRLEVHRLQPLRARLRGNAGDLRADHLGPRLRQPRVAGHVRELPGQRVRVVRRLRAGLPDGDAEREVADPDRPAGALGGDDLRLLRRRLHVQGRDARRGSGAHGAVQGRQGQPRPLVREGPLRLGLRHAPRAAAQAADAREDHRPVAREPRGKRRSAASPRSSPASRSSTAATRSAASPRRAAPTRRPSSCRS